MTSQSVSPFIGNGAYCYADALAMLLASSGTAWDPSTLECLSSVGLGARWRPREQDIYFSLVPPDRGISIALALSNIEVKEQVSDEGAAPPFERLRELLESGPVLLGPLDMGHLSYLPNAGRAQGCDHFALLVSLNGDEARLHDPLGYPNVAIALKDLAMAWAAGRIPYARGAYRCWAAPIPGPRPNDAALRASGLEAIRAAYCEGEAGASRQGVLSGEAAFAAAADHLGSGKGENLRRQLIDFGLPLGARRAHDLAVFLRPDHPRLAEIKGRQALAFIDGFAAAVHRNDEALVRAIRQIGDLDEDFRQEL